MTTANPKETRKSAKGTVLYVYRGDGHEHPVDADNVVHLGGNITSNPLRTSLDGSNHFELDNMISELENWGALNKNAQKCFKHYVISISNNDFGKVSNSDWLILANQYMQALGFGNDTKWTCALHNDTSLSHKSNVLGKDGGQHIHIVACLAQAALKGELVKTSKDYEKGWPVMRAFEEKHNLVKLASPGDVNDFGFNFTKAQMKGHGSRKKCLENDWAAIIRARIKNLYQAEGNPKTIKEFSLGLAKRNVNIQAVKNDDGSIRGINYQVISFKKNGKVMDSPLISGSKVKGTRFTWNKLQTKEGMSYKPERDDPFITLAPLPKKLIASVKVNNVQIKAIKTLGVSIRSNKRNSGYVDLSFCRSKNEKNMVMMIAAIMDILKVLFSRDDVLFAYEAHENQEQAIEYDLSNEPSKIVNEIHYDLQYNIWNSLTDDDKNQESPIDLAA